MDPHRVLIHCNAGGGYGMGHLMRSLALAEESISQAWEVRVGGDLSETATDLLETRTPGVAVALVPPASVRAWLRDQTNEWDPDVLHVDSYWLAEDDVPSGRHLVSAMQDGPFGVVAAGLAIDETLGAEDHLARPLRSARYLLGSSAAPIRRQVLDRRDRSYVPTTQPRVLVVIGGTDPHGLTTTVIDGLEAIDRPMWVTVVVPSGQRAAVEQHAARSRHEITAVGFVPDLPALAQSHDFVVCAAGTSVWDFACMGLPMGLVCVTQNQVRGYRSAVASRIAVGLGVPSHDGLRARLASLADVVFDAQALTELGRRGAEAIDGLGAWRIVSTWGQLVDAPALGRPQPDLVVRRAVLSDASLLHSWRNEPETRQASRTTAPIPWDEHLAWFSTSLRRADRILLVVERNRSPIGVVRWDRRSCHAWEVSIALAPEARGQGFALPALLTAEAALAPMGTVQLVATVRRDNVASLRSFAAAGYLPHLPADAQGFATLAKWVVAPDAPSPAGDDT